VKSERRPDYETGIARKKVSYEKGEKEKLHNGYTDGQKSRFYSESMKFQLDYKKEA